MKSYKLDEGEEVIEHDKDICNQAPVSRARMQQQIANAGARDRAELLTSYLNQLKLPEVLQEDLDAPVGKADDPDAVVNTIIEVINSQTARWMREAMRYKAIIAECLTMIGERNENVRYAEQLCTCGAFKRSYLSSMDSEAALRRIREAANTNTAPRKQPKIGCVTGIGDSWSVPIWKVKISS